MSPETIFVHVPVRKMRATHMIGQSKFRKQQIVALENVDDDILIHPHLGSAANKL
jgi:hypothetical protein